MAFKGSASELKTVGAGAAAVTFVHGCNGGKTFTAVVADFGADLENDGVNGLSVDASSCLVLVRSVCWLAVVGEEACLPLVVEATGANKEVE